MFESVDEILLIPFAFDTFLFVEKFEFACTFFFFVTISVFLIFET